jgi:hypothetical protein
VRNRGTQTATGVVVKAFHCTPSVGLVWPNDWQAMTTMQLTAPDVPAGGEVKVGPFSWTPVAAGHECMLMIASAVGDPSNIDNFTAGDSIPEWRLVPHDNNIGQRNVAPVAAGGLDGLLEALTDRPFTVHNPLGKKAGIRLNATLPSVLERAGWQLQVTSPGGAAFALRDGEAKEVRFSLLPGSTEALATLKTVPELERQIVISVTADGRTIGGMTYALDPELKAEPSEGHDTDDTRNEHEHDHHHADAEVCQAKAGELIRCLGQDGEVASVRISKVSVEIILEDC